MGSKDRTTIFKLGSSPCLSVFFIFSLYLLLFFFRSPGIPKEPPLFHTLSASLFFSHFFFLSEDSPSSSHLPFIYSLPSFSVSRPEPPLCFSRDFSISFLLGAPFGELLPFSSGTPLFLLFSPQESSLLGLLFNKFFFHLTFSNHLPFFIISFFI